MHMRCTLEWLNSETDAPSKEGRLNRKEKVEDNWPPCETLLPQRLHKRRDFVVGDPVKLPVAPPVVSAGAPAAKKQWA